MNTIFISITNNTFTFLMLHKSESDLQLTSLPERRPACSSANASLGCMSFRAQKQRKRQHKCLSHICMVYFWLDCWKLRHGTPLPCQDRECTCWRCVAGKTAADFLPGAQKAAGRCRRGAEAAALGPWWSCTAWSCSTGKHRTQN